MDLADEEGEGVNGLGSGLDREKRRLKKEKGDLGLREMGDGEKEGEKGEIFFCFLEW